MPGKHPAMRATSPLYSPLRWLTPALLLVLGGCASLGDDLGDSLGYYWQSVSGHVKLMNAARPVPDWLADAGAPAKLKARLELSQRIRDYAVAELHLPDNASYRRYADLHRAAVVWNVVAAPPDSLALKTWCFPVTGCVGYRGYFDEADAKAEAVKQQAAGLETMTYGVPAYSTLGWLNWLGGDPLLNTFIGYPEGELARLIFHELSHQVAFAPGDTMFNESFATAVERLGGARWLAERASPEARAEYATYNDRRNAFKALTLDTRRALEAIYPADGQPAPPDLAAQKAQAMATFRARYAELKAAWGGFAGYDGWVARANNASFGAQAAYDELVPGFEALFERERRAGPDPWPRFYHAVKELAALSRQARRDALERALKETPTMEKAGA